MKSNIREEIRNLKIFSKRLVHSAMAGDYAAAFKGTGFEFDQIREYVAGDDVRFVDWNASAKAGSLMVKECVPERDRTIIFAIDCSASNLYSSQENLRKTVILQVASALAFIANNTHDKVGALLFSDTVHQWFAPKCGEGHIAKILESIYSITASGKATNFSECFKFLADLRKKNAVLFVISDWIAGCDESSHEGYIQYERLLKLISCEYDLVAVRVLDECEYDFPRVGVTYVQDSESDEVIMIDAHSEELQRCLKARSSEQKALFESFGADVLDLTIGSDLAREFASFFHRRIGRQV